MSFNEIGSKLASEIYAQWLNGDNADADTNNSIPHLYNADSDTDNNIPHLNTFAISEQVVITELSNLKILTKSILYQLVFLKCPQTSSHHVQISQ